MTYSEPLLVLLLAIALLSLMRLWRDRRIRPALLAVLGLVVLTWPPAEWLISQPLEWRYPPHPFHADPPPDAIVVLSASVNPPRFQRPYELLGDQTFARCEFAVRLHQQLPAVPILTCGGPESSASAPYAATMRDYLLRNGVPPDLLWTEERSRSTHENAVFGAEILRRHGIGRIALVVDTQSMLRAEGCFRKEGITVTPAPSSFHDFEFRTADWLPNWRAMRRNEASLHEYLGLAWYRMHGWI